VKFFCGSILQFYDFFWKNVLSGVKCVFSAKFGQFCEIKKIEKTQEFAHMKCNGICDFWSLENKCRQSS